MKPNSFLLSIITPFFARSLDDYLVQRARYFIEIAQPHPWLERIIVDHGSPRRISNLIHEACDKKGIKYVTLNRGDTPFSAGQCRNHGAQIALGAFISFQDIDLVAPVTLYEKIKESLTTREVPFNHLEIIPCFYLTREATEKFIKMDPVAAERWVYESYLEGDRSVIHLTAPVTSSILLHKEFYLSEGGMREEFFGHGYEDFELMHRLAYRARKFHRSHDYYSHSHPYDSQEYKGYRTYFSMYGRQNLAERKFYIHLYHDTVVEDGYKERNTRNRELFETFSKRFDDNLDAPPALDNLTSNEVTLCIGSRISIPFKGIRQAIPFLGRVLYRSEFDFKGTDDFHQFLLGNQVTSILFLTPYTNSQRLTLYEWAKSFGFRYMVFDRGALPDSWFFDAGGFNGESISYSPDKWNKPLSEEETYECEHYIQNLCASDKTLEDNGPRIGEFEFRRKYGLLDKRVLFVPLQRPNDSVIRFLSGNVSGVDHFCEEISKLSRSLGPEWRIILKQHPLETVTPAIPGVTVLSTDTHVYDAISAADAIALINSGVGLLGLCFGKPVFCFGKAFYAHPGLAETVTDAEDLHRKLTHIHPPNKEVVLRFIHYLTNEFYSFAETTYKKVQEGSQLRSVATHLEFSRLKLPGRPPILFSYRKEPAKITSPLYDYYRSYIATKLRGKELQVKEQAKATRESRGTEAPPSRLKQKLRKLIKNPRLFIRDAILKRL